WDRDVQVDRRVRMGLPDQDRIAHRGLAWVACVLDRPHGSVAMNVEAALIHALARGERVTVYDASGNLKGTSHDPRVESERTWLRMIAADDPSVRFGTTGMAHGEGS